MDGVSWSGKSSGAAQGAAYTYRILAFPSREVEGGYRGGSGILAPTITWTKPFDVDELKARLLPDIVFWTGKDHLVGSPQ